VTETLPGDLRRRLDLEQLVRTSDGGGGFAEGWTILATLSAELRPITGGEQVEADRLAGRISHEVTLRYREGVMPAMRFRLGARIFHILAVIDVEGRKRWLKCLCEERDL
jgi:SPP1 family predicted phage head-tail adaptor